MLAGFDAPCYLPAMLTVFSLCAQLAITSPILNLPPLPILPAAVRNFSDCTTAGPWVEDCNKGIVDACYCAALRSGEQSHCEKACRGGDGRGCPVPPVHGHGANSGTENHFQILNTSCEQGNMIGCGRFYWAFANRYGLHVLKTKHYRYQLALVTKRLFAKCQNGEFESCYTLAGIFERLDELLTVEACDAGDAAACIGKDDAEAMATDGMPDDEDHEQRWIKFMATTKRENRYGPVSFSACISGFRWNNCHTLGEKLNMKGTNLESKSCFHSSSAPCVIRSEWVGRGIFEPCGT